MNKSLSSCNQRSVTSLIKPRKSQLAIAVSVGLAIMSGSVMAASDLAITAEPAQKTTAEPSSDETSRPSLEVITVTATRRTAKLADIPYNISAVSGDQLSKVGATGLMDVVNMVPGLASPDTGQRQSVNNSLIMRGLNANNPGRNSLTQNMTDPAVSMYVNDIPMFFNVSLSDIERVEVLRGPQGTLYGSGSVGGTLRMILNEPLLDTAEGRVSAQISNNSESGELNYQTDFVGNLPLSDDVALRINAGYTDIGGVTDANGLAVLGSDGAPVLVGDIDSAAQLTSKKDTDESNSWYLRGSLLVEFNDDVSAILNVIHQKNEGEGDTIGRITDNDSAVTPWQHTRRLLTSAEFETDVMSLEVTVDLGFASLTSATGYSKNDQFTDNDNSGLYADLSSLYFGFPEGQTAVATSVDQQSKSFTQEFRLVSQTEGDWDWVTGVWYRDQEQNAEFIDNYLGYERWASDPSSSGSVDVQGFSSFATVAEFWADYQGTPSAELTNPYVQNRAMDFQDIAIFGEATYHINDDWQVTVGARQFWQEFSQDNLVEFRILGPDFTVDQQSSADFNDHIFKFNTSYDLAEDTMVYFTWAQGFRHGGTNGFPTVGTGAVTSVPLQYEADKAKNYEMGLKGELFGSQARYTASIYQIDWDKPQLDVFLGLLAVPSVMNGDMARSRGVELEVAVQLTDDLDMTLGYSFTDAELEGDDLRVEGASGFTVAHAGDPLPGVPSNQLSLTMNYFVPLESGNELHFFYNGSYHDEVETTFNADFADYAKLDGFATHNIGINWKFEEVKVGLFVKNLTNEEGLSGVRINRPGFNDFGYLSRPRSIGLRFSYEFE